MASDRSPGPERLAGDFEQRLETPASRPAKRPPLGGKLRLPRRRPLREGVLTAFSRVLGAARRFARRAGDDPVAAVHEYRKSLRRARAVVSLLSPALGKPAAKGLTGHLQSAFRATNAFRDADILLQTLRCVPAAPEDDLPRHAIEVALELEQRRSRAETSETLAHGLRRLSPLPAAMEVVLDPRFSARDLERGLARSRRRERRALERARETGRDEDLHEWRKRLKELRYQLELFASTGSAELKKREKALGQLAQDLGNVTDLIVLKGEIARRQREGTVPPAPALIDRMARLSSLRSGEILERGVRLFEDDPKAFARQVIGERG
jgi:CHAD domain-containing protein